MEYIKWLDEVSQESSFITGKKAATLGEIKKIGLPTPDGFVITIKAFEKILEYNQLKEKISETIKNKPDQLSASEEIKSLIIKNDYSPSVKDEIIQSYNKLSVSKEIELPSVIPLISAGREYAIVSIRGSTVEDLDSKSFLNIKGVRDLLDSVKECWSSLYSKNNISQLIQNNFKSGIAVLIQKMVSADKSGRMFSNGDETVTIESSWGLGTVLESIQPDSYVVDKYGKILKKSISRKEVMHIRDIASDKTIEVSVPKEKVEIETLTEDEILKILYYWSILEKHLSILDRITFAIERGKIRILGLKKGLLNAI